MKKRSKKYLAALDKIDKNKLYSISEAVKLVKEVATTTFDASVEVAVKLNIDSKKTEQQLRGAIVLPHGTGKNKKVLVVAKGDLANEAKEIADYVGDIDILNKIEQEQWLDFDVIIASPDMMPALGKLGKILGPKGLMPNPKTGSVTVDIKKAVLDVKKGKIEYKTDTDGNVHVIIGKVSFEENKLIENFTAFMNEIVKNKPLTVKANYIKSITLVTTMSPGIKINTDFL